MPIQITPMREQKEEKTKIDDRVTIDEISPDLSLYLSDKKPYNIYGKWVGIKAIITV
jgi:hypothetical protein